MSDIINWASVIRGAYATCDNGHADTNRDLPLTEGIHQPDEIYQGCPNTVTYTIHLLRPVPINTIIVRLYYTDGRSYTFSMFETSPDGETWTQVVAPGTVRSQTFTEHFATRVVSKIRMRASNSSNPWLHIIRFQAFYVPEEREYYPIPAIAPPVPLQALATSSAGGPVSAVKNPK